MAAILTVNERISDIVREIEKLDNAEQELLLKKLRLQKYLDGKVKIARSPKDTKPVSMREIDRLKHKMRKEYAGK